ncbi:MAG: DUF4202 domain-containing protein [Microthrixaceae bacterium]
MAKQVSALYESACEQIDSANSQDPNTINYQGHSHCKELLHSQMMTTWVERLDSEATEEQLLAARAHHFRRWIYPRSDFPAGRSGYLRWRSQAKKRQAAEVAELLINCGYPQESVQRVATIIRKEHLSSDSDVQTHEDALCLVFLDTQLDSVAHKLGDSEMVEVIIKTLPKMSPQGIDAVSLLELSPEGADLVARAVTAFSNSDS